MRCSSFSQVAEQAFTTQSNVSKNIKTLEEALGQQLFVRQKKGIIPTQKAILLNLELTDAKNSICNILGIDGTHSSRKNLNIGFCQNIFFPKVIPSFFKMLNSDAFKSVDVNMHCYEVNDVISDIMDSTIDLGIILSDKSFINSQIKVKNIALDTPRIYFSENCPLCQKQKIVISDFASFPIITTKYLIEQNEYKMINYLPFNPQSIKIVDSYDDIIFYLTIGTYITVLRPYVTLAFNDSIRSFPLDNYGISQGISAIWLASNDNSYLKKILNYI